MKDFIKVDNVTLAYDEGRSCYLLGQRDVVDVLTTKVAVIPENNAQAVIDAFRDFHAKRKAALYFKNMDKSGKPLWFLNMTNDVLSEMYNDWLNLGEDTASDKWGISRTQLYEAFGEIEVEL